MTLRPFVAALAVGVSLSVAAQALPANAASTAAKTPETASKSAWVDPPPATVPAKSNAIAAAPSVDHTSAITPQKSAVSETKLSAPQVSQPVAKPSAETKSARKAEEPVSANAIAPKAPAPRIASAASAPKKPAVRVARYASNEGAAWSMGRNAYGFSGNFGGCRITGRAGPHGFTIDRSC